MTQPTRNRENLKEALYTYYKITLENSPLNWNETICESLEQVLDTLKYLDIYLDDDESELRVIITGVGMTKAAYKTYNDDCEENYYLKTNS
jgi:hypothetical protein